MTNEEVEVQAKENVLSLLHNICTLDYTVEDMTNEIDGMPYKELGLLREEIKKLVHHRDITCGLWATDGPEFITERQMLFEITY